MGNPSLRIALANVSIGLEEAKTLEDVKSVIADLITSLDDCVCEEDEDG